MLPFNVGLKLFPVCSFCEKPHTNFQACVQLCVYCQSIHLKTDLVEGMCPKMAVFAKKLQQRQRAECKYCQDAQLNHISSFLSSPNIAVVSKVDCAQCKGRKYLPRLLFCCSQGCSRCGFTGFVINPAAKLEHMEPKESLQSFECSICLLTVKQGQSIFTMQCNHSFHYECLCGWVELGSKACPICRMQDMFLEGGCKSPKVLRVHLNENGEFQEGSGEDSFSDEEFVE